MASKAEQAAMAKYLRLREKLESVRPTIENTPPPGYDAMTPRGRPAPYYNPRTIAAETGGPSPRRTSPPPRSPQVLRAALAKEVGGDLGGRMPQPKGANEAMIFPKTMYQGELPPGIPHPTGPTGGAPIPAQPPIGVPTEQSVQGAGPVPPAAMLRAHPDNRGENIVPPGISEGGTNLTTETVHPTPDPNDYRPSVGELWRTLQAMKDPLDYAGLKQVNDARRTSSSRDRLAGMALQSLGGSRFGGMGAKVFEKALADSDPLRPNLADVGYFDPETGEFFENPVPARERERKAITGELKDLQKEFHDEDVLDETIAKRRQQQEQFDETLAETKRNNDMKATHNRLVREAKAIQDGKQEPIKGLLSEAGGPVFLNPDTGEFVNAQGDPTVPDTTTAYGKRSDAIRQANFDIGELDRIKGNVENNPEGFGVIAGVQSNIPWISNKWDWSRMPAGSKEARLAVYQNAYQIIKDLAGTAVSDSEKKRLEEFLPNKYDTWQDIKRKMEGAKLTARRQLATHTKPTPKRRSTDVDDGEGPNPPDEGSAMGSLGITEVN